MDKKQLLIYNELISKYNFNEKQKHQIKIGVYQMKEIRLNLWSINKQISDHNC